MNPKTRRLETLRALGGNVPETFASLAAFAETPRNPEALWWIRATAEQPDERYRMRQGPWTTNEITELASTAAKTHLVACAIQRYLEPELSGITYVARDWMLTAAIERSCRALLRGGSSGALLAQRGDERWASGSTHLPANARPAIEAATRTVGAIGRDILVEWIVTSDGAIHHVDYKEIADALMPPPFPRPNSIAVGNGHWAEPPELLDSTRIEHLSPSSEPQNLRCRTGSPLAHLCIEVALRNGRVIVDRPGGA